MCIGAGCSGASPGTAILVAAGGGGGGVSNCAGTPGGNGGTGGTGSSTSASGGAGPSGANGGGGGNSGSGSGGGSGGTGGVNSAASQGPNGESGTNSSGGAAVNVAGGGGGAGFEGGGKGGNSATGCKGAGGGGGGSSWAVNSATAVAYSSNSNSAGSATVTFADPLTCAVEGQPMDASNEAEYRLALLCMSAFSTGPNTINLTGDITLDDGSDPTYSGSVPLTINGNGYTVDADNTSRGLNVTSSAHLEVRRLSVVNGTGATGAGIYAAGPATVNNSTLTANSASTAGGGIATGVWLTINHSTVAANTAPTGANIKAGGLLTSAASVIADPSGGDNCSLAAGSFSSNSWSDDGSCQLTGTGDTQNGADALLGQGRNNGGVTGGSPRTMFPLLGSPLIDAIDAADCIAGLPRDQRDVPRPFGAGCDIGAIESIFPAHSMNDVSPFYEATVRWVTSAVNTPRILAGYSDSTFRQQLPITRGQVARLYYRAAGAPNVSGLPAHGLNDVTPFFEDAVRWTKANGIFDGYPDNSFRQSNNITRGNYTRSLYGFAGAKDVTGLPAHGFDDVTPFYEDAVTWAKANALADGFPDNTFRQTNNITRGNSSRLFYNLAQSKPAWADTMAAPPNMLFKANV